MRRPSASTRATRPRATTRASCSRRPGRYAEAEQEFRAALALDPGLAMAESNLATARARLGDYQDAIAHYERALALGSRRTPSRTRASATRSCCSAGSTRRSRSYREALRWAPDTVSARRSLARTLRRAGREAEAEEEERLARTSTP